MKVVAVDDHLMPTTLRGPPGLKTDLTSTRRFVTIELFLWETDQSKPPDPLDAFNTVAAD